jgi:xanthine dehydrogenase YagS FAD-binding subunit
MKPFDFASPDRLAQAIALLSSRWGPTEILAGGTDLLALMKDHVVTPNRLVNIKRLAGLSNVDFSPSKGLTVGALVTLDELSNHPAVTRHYPVLALAIHDAASPQIRNRATLGGNLCQRPRCWYFRNGYGLLALDAKGRSLVELGDNRYHAILGNTGPAYFVSASTVAPTLIALDARVVLAGPAGRRTLLLENFFHTPLKPTQRERDLLPNEVLVEVRVPPPPKADVAYYEVRQKHGFDWPLATATVVLRPDARQVDTATVIMSHVAPTPWRAKDAETVLAGRSVTVELAKAAAGAAVKGARDLGQNGYKIAIAQATVERALRQAAGMETIPP